MILMRCIAATVVLSACMASAQELDGAPDELVRAEAAVAQGHFKEARLLLARVQVFECRTEWMPAALYYEALIDAKSGGSSAGVSALKELMELYPDSLWAHRAAKEFGNLSAGE